MLKSTHTQNAELFFFGVKGNENYDERCQDGKKKKKKEFCKKSII